jgi:hypothetical protein
VTLSLAGTTAVAVALGFVVAGRRDELTHSLQSAPLWILGLVVLLQVVALLARTEAWNFCLGATGATIGRRLLSRRDALAEITVSSAIAPRSCRLQYTNFSTIGETGSTRGVAGRSGGSCVEFVSKSRLKAFALVSKEGR